jgi:hypothetical protein
VSNSLFTIGVSSCGKGDARSGVSLISAARRTYREYGVAEGAIEQAVLGSIERNTRKALGDDGYEAAVRRGEALARDEAIELALSIAPD